MNTDRTAASITRPSRIAVTTLALIITALLGVAFLSSCSSKVEPRGPVPKYKVVGREVHGSAGSRSIRYQIEADSREDSALQFAAQQLIIKETARDGAVQQVNVDFMDAINKSEFPIASMQWIRKQEKGFLEGLGIADPDPFDTGRWNWSASIPASTEIPPIAIDEVTIEESDGTVRVEGNITKELRKLTYAVYEPTTKPLGKITPIPVPKVGEKLSLAWKPPAGFEPAEGVYIMRLVGTLASGEGAPEMWLKLDLLEKEWRQPAEVIPSVPAAADEAPSK